MVARKLVYSSVRWSFVEECKEKKIYIENCEAISQRNMKKIYFQSMNRK